jgi:DNA polymerase-3 subunit alpha
VRWSDIERLNKERDLVGIYLSAHPLDAYKVILDNLCNARCADLADRGTALMDREDVTLGGIVTGIQTRFSKNNKPWGIVTLEDFEGSGDLTLFGDDWLALNGKFIEGAAVFITGKIQSRYYASDQKELKVTNVELLQTVKERAIDRITISIITDEGVFDNRIVEELSEIINECPGNTKLFFQLRDGQGKHHVLMRADKHGVDVRHTLIDYIDAHAMMDYKIN